MKRITLLMLCSSMLSCNRTIDASSDSKAILALQQQERTAHFNKDADLFLSEFAPAVYMLNKGKVDSSSVEVHKKKIQSYFNAVKFIKWDDMAEPIIQFADDHSMAYAIIQKQVILERKDSAGKTVNDTTDFAWTSIYRKLNNQWKLVSNTSTNK